MHLKLDENADPRWRIPLEAAGNTVSTVPKKNYRERRTRHDHLPFETDDLDLTI
jgi:hypothetical protein